MAERLAFLLPDVLASDNAVELFRLLLVREGRALTPGRTDAWESGRRDFPLTVIGMVRKFAPDRAAALLEPHPEEDVAAQKAKVSE